ncbi:hypothetical protein E8E11_003733 [Didymella keratinophila]|nr:hypothetical protein E8E11_003733 [Didymella keratinophila]
MPFLFLTTKKAKPGIPGQFILWHRYFTATYDIALRQEGGFTVAQSYWDYMLDADVYSSEISQPDTGFGGNGVKVELTPEQNSLNLTGGTGGGCVETSPFISDKVTVNYPGPPSCLRRDSMPPLLNTWADPKLEKAQLEAPDFVTFDRTMQGSKTVFAPNIHGSGHFGVGGVLRQAGDPAHSPAEPLFYLHHANLDYIYWEWQQRDSLTRLLEVGGPIVAENYRITRSISEG